MGHMKSTESTVVEKETVMKIGIESERLSSTDDYLACEERLQDIVNSQNKNEQRWSCTSDEYARR